MRILAIRGANLASLAARFELNFEAEPLASAGVFAITGPTGAGKSTLLDALCLALYHATPRLANILDGQVSLEVGSDTLTARDARHALRRGTAEGFAEVDFLGSDEEEYRARWSISRARRRADGQLQDAKCTLTRLRDGLLIGRTTSEIRKEIADRIGLSFAQFQRAVLLAQNEFAAFLRSNSDERADLLEALTGNYQYAALSVACFARARDERNALLALQKNKGEPQLSEEARAQLLGDLQAATEAEQSARQQLERWRHEISKLEQLAQSERHLADIAQQLMQAESQWQQATPRWLSLQRLSLAEPARSFSQARSNAELALQIASTRRADAQRTLSEQSRARANSAEARTLSERAREQARAAQELAVPRLAEALELQRELLRLGNEARRLLSEQANLQTQLPPARQAVQQRSVDLQKVQQELDAWAAWQRREPEVAGHDANWPALDKLISQAERAALELARAQAQHAERLPLATAAQTRRAQLRDEQQRCEAELQRAETRVRETQQAWQWLDPQALLEREDAWQQRERGFGQLRDALQRVRERSAHRDNLRSAVQALAERLERARSEALAVPEQLVRAAAEWSALQRSYEHTLSVTGSHAQALRAKLQADLPCPVCGATEHPFRHEAPVLEALCVAQAQAVAEARQVVEQLERSKRRLDSEIQDSAQRKAQLEAESAPAENQLALAHEQFVEQAEALGLQLQVARELDPLPEESSPLDQAWQRHRQLLATLERERQALDQAQVLVQQAAAARETAAEAERTARTVLERATPGFEHSLAQLASAQETLTLAEHQAQRSVDQLRVALPGATAELSAWRMRFQAGDQLRTQAQHACARQAGLQQAQISAQQHLDALEAQLAQLAKQSAEIDLRSSAARTRRSEVLEAADAEAELLRHQQAVAAAQRAFEQALAQENLLEAALSGAQARHEAEIRAVQAAEQAAQSAAQQVQDWLQQHAPTLGLAADDLSGLEQLLSTRSDWRAELSTLQQQQRQREDLQISHAALANELAARRAQCEGGHSQAELDELLAEAKQRQNDCLQSVIQLRAQHQQDQARQARDIEQQAQLAPLQARCEIWEKLNGLIGSSDGRAFKRYALGSTLDVLLTHANAQLEKFAARYQLQRVRDSLSLLVLDRDLGDEIRPAHSLSGGETFLVSLALALGLAALSSTRVRVESLFIDEGFGSLDAETLRVAMEALDRLYAQGRRVGVISHVQELAERIGTQVVVRPVAPGRSVVEVRG